MQKLFNEPFCIIFGQYVLNGRIHHQINTNTKDLFTHHTIKDQIYNQDKLKNTNKFYPSSAYTKQSNKILQQQLKISNLLIIFQYFSAIIKIIMDKNTDRKNIKALLCQICPVHKDKNATIQRISKSFQMYSSVNKIDIVVFPEMSFVGYNFVNKQQALPFADFQEEGVDFYFASDLANKLNSYVAFGYIEKAIDEKQNISLYNSAAVIDRSGKMICNYRKSQLYYNDKLWATQGNQFKHFDLITTQQQKIRCLLGICMDINPKDFTSGQFELANKAITSKSQVLIFLTNWVDSQKIQIDSNDVSATYTYWLHRLQPILVKKHNFLVLAADRCGVQYDVFAKKNTRFYGSSCGIMLNPNKIIKNLDVKSEGYLLIQTFISRQIQKEQ